MNRASQFFAANTGRRVALFLLSMGVMMMAARFAISAPQAASIPEGTAAGKFSAVAWNGDLFVAVGGMADNHAEGATVATSPDGVFWTKYDTDAGPPDASLASITWNGSLFIALGGNETNPGSLMATSPNGLTWTAHTAPEDALLYGVTWDGTQFGVTDQSTGMGGFSQLVAPKVAQAVTASVAPNITAQPANKIVTAGQPAIFKVTAKGTAPLTYQWQVSVNGGGFSNITGATASSLTITTTKGDDSLDGNQYRVIVKNAAMPSGVTSIAATLSVNVPPTITVSASPIEGGSVSGGGTYATGSTHTVKATAKKGYTFVNWTEGGNIVSTGPAYTFVLTTSRNLVANFIYSLQIQTPALPHATVGQVYSQVAATATGGTEPYAFVIATASGFPPIGMHLDGSGTLTGTPSVPGTYTFSITVTDLVARVSTRKTTIVVDPITMTMADVSQTEGNSGTTDFVFMVTLSGSSPLNVSVNYSTKGGTAKAGSDYVEIPVGPPESASKLLFLPGETSKNITVHVYGDTTFEADETFFVNLAFPINVKLLDKQAVGTILNDDLKNPPAAAISVDSGTMALTHSITYPNITTVSKTVMVTSTTPWTGAGTDLGTYGDFTVSPDHGPAGTTQVTISYASFGYGTEDGYVRFRTTTIGIYADVAVTVNK